jgi:hypothetical protein
MNERRESGRRVGRGTKFNGRIGRNFWIEVDKLVMRNGGKESSTFN